MRIFIARDDKPAERNRTKVERDYEAWLQRDEEIAHSQEARIRRELLGEFVDIETGCPWEEVEESIPVAVEINRKEAA
jgi:hypothetical protein